MSNSFHKVVQAAIVTFLPSCGRALTDFISAGRLCHLDNSAEQLRWRAEGQDLDDSDTEDGMILDAGDLDQEAQVLERSAVMYACLPLVIYTAFSDCAC